MKTKWGEFKNVRGSGGKIKIGTVKFTYTPPTETETNIYDIEGALRCLKPLRTYLEGLRHGGGLTNDILPYNTPNIIARIIERNEERLRELKRQDGEEKEQKGKKSKV